MMTTTPQSTPDAPRPRGFLYDDLPYLLPMAIFLLLTWLGGYGAPEKLSAPAATTAATQPAQWSDWYPISYVLKTFLAAGALAYFWKHYTRISWRYWRLGVIVGVIGIVQWVGMEKLLLQWWPDYPRPNVGQPFDPYAHFAGQPALMWAFTLIRWAGAALVVPVMEELFWRDYLWRTILAPNDFRLASVGEWDGKVFIIVAAAFATVHVQWMTAAVWGLLIGWLLVNTRSLGACIIAHGVTNLLLGAYVQYTRDWYFW